VQLNSDYFNVGVIVDSSGNLWGTSGYGYYGNIFEIVKGTGTITPVASFDDYNGWGPNGLIMDGSGNFYGTTYQGGDHGSGTVFEMVKGSGTITALASFNYYDSSILAGGHPRGDLVIDDRGNLYGVTTAGGSTDGKGDIFEVVKGSGTVTDLAPFYSDHIFQLNTAGSISNLVLDSNSNLYGATPEGGPTHQGIIFELAQGSNTITSLASFNPANISGTYNMPNGAMPNGLIINEDGHLCSTTRSWSSLTGAHGDGTVFELTGLTITGPGQTTLTGNQHFVQALYEDDLGRTGDLYNPNDAGYWVNRLDNGTLNQAAVATGILHSHEAQTYLVATWYQTYLVLQRHLPLDRFA
jgi:uncharacterized repeat protein (TIGR03803 family)